MAQEAIRLFTRVGDDEQLSQLNRHLAWSLNELGRHSEALLAAETAASLAEKNQDDYNLEWALLQVFRASYALNRYDYALATYLKG